MAHGRPHDLVLVGATGYTGGLAADYLARQAPRALRWAIAGRDLDRVAAVATSLPSSGPATRPGVLCADLADESGLQRLAASTRVVLSTAGPYLRTGAPLVRACAQAGTHYADISGEAEFVDRAWLGYHEMARASGARIVPACGFEAAIADLGAWFTAGLLPHDAPKQIEAYTCVDSTFSLGTPLHSLVISLSRVPQRRAARRQRQAAEEPTPGRRIGATRQRVHFNRDLGAWALPLPSVDPQIVRGSAAALSEYGPDFRYGHYLQLGSIGKLIAVAAGATALVAASQMGVTRRWLLSLRPAGAGPTVDQRARGRFRVTFLGRAGGAQVRAQVTGGDPGYDETSKLLAECGLCLALDRLPPGAGVLTPVQAMGVALLARIQRAGISFDEVESPSSERSPNPRRRNNDHRRPTV